MKTLIQTIVAAVFWTITAAEGNEPLSNADVIKMVKASLPESTIILAIQNTPSAFETGPDALIELKSAGLGDKIIEAMLTARAHSAGPAPVSPSNGDQLPVAYGFYALVNGKQVLLLPTQVQQVFGLIVGGDSDRGIAVDGFSASAEAATVDDPAVVFIAYQHAINPSILRLSLLKHVTDMQTMEFNILNTKSDFFENVYGVSPYKIVKVNLLRPVQDVGLRVEPMAGRPDMYRLIPTQPLQPGMNYALYAAGVLHPGDVAFTASRNSSGGSGVLFKIPVRNPSEIAATERALGQFLKETLGRTPRSPEQPDKKYLDTKAGVTVYYPSDFEVHPGQRPIVAFFWAPSNGEPDQSRNKISVTCAPTPILNRNPSLDAVLTETLTGTRSSLGGATIAGPFKATLAGAEARIFIATGLEQGVLRQKAVTVGVCRKHVLGVVLHATPQTFPKVWDAYKRVCDSYELK